MNVLLLGAGYATRLYPLTRDKPKPLLPVAGTPILERIISKINRIAGLERIFVVSNHRFISNYENWLADFRGRSKPSVPVEIIDDGTSTLEDKLGAVGDIYFVVEKKKLDDDLLVIAGDNLIEFNVGDLVKYAQKKNSSAVALKDMKESALISQYSVVTLDKESRIVDFEEKPPSPSTSLISIGVYYFAMQNLPLVAQYIAEGHNRDAPGYYIQWLYQQIPLYGYVTKERWFDIGDIDSYNMANEMFLSE